MTVVAEFIVPVERVHLFPNHPLGLTEWEGLHGAARTEVLAPLGIAVEEILQTGSLEEAEPNGHRDLITGFPITERISLPKAHDIRDLRAAARTLHDEGGLLRGPILRNGQPHGAEFVVIGCEEEKSTPLRRAPSEAWCRNTPGIDLDRGDRAVFVQMGLVGDADRLFDPIMGGVGPEGGVRDIDDLETIPVIDHAGGKDIGLWIPSGKIRDQFDTRCRRASFGQLDHRRHVEGNRSPRDLRYGGAGLPVSAIQRGTAIPGEIMN